VIILNKKTLSKKLIVYFNVIVCFTLFVCGYNDQNLKSENKQNGGNVFDSSIVFFNIDSVSSLFKEKLTSDFCYIGCEYFLIISNLTEKETKSICDNSIKSAVQCFYNDYFEKKPTELVTVLLFKNDGTYRHWAEVLFGDTDLSPYGYYKTSKQIMLMNIATGSGTLIHEITHALVRYDFPDIPSWFNEGLGSLYERSSLKDKEIIGYVNWRLPALQKAISNDYYKSLETLMKADDDEFYGENSGLNYSQARYFCLYLQEKNLLKKYYKTFRDRYDEDNTGIRFAEEIFGRKLKLEDEDFKKWALQLVINN
jgi:hypothetical protein